GLTEELPAFQFHVVDGDEILSRARTIPLRWDGTIEDLPAGIDGAIARGFDEGGANTLCALVIMVPRAVQGQGASRRALEGMVEIAGGHGLSALIAPVRPSWKERYPLTPIARYAECRRGDGLLFDPWLRTHERLGAETLAAEPRSMRITGSVAEWEEWGDGLPGERRVHVPRRADDAHGRPRGRRRALLGAQRLDAPHGLR